MLSNLFNWISSRRQPKPAPSWKRDLGGRGETFAARHLRRRGYKVLVRRFRSRAGEIDLVCRDGEWLVFVEVKTRVNEDLGAPSEAVDATKQRHMSKVALDYLRLLGYPEVPFRFDIAEVILPKGARRPSEVRVIQNAFEMSEPYVY
jgi:putative endonuclease